MNELAQNELLEIEAGNRIGWAMGMVSCGAMIGLGLTTVGVGIAVAMFGPSCAGSIAAGLFG